jgi:integrase
MQRQSNRGKAFRTLRTSDCTSFNRSMRLEAIAALLGHRSMEMTLTYARIAKPGRR